MKLPTRGQRTPRARRSARLAGLAASLLGLGFALGWLASSETGWQGAADRLLSPVRSFEAALRGPKLRAIAIDIAFDDLDAIHQQRESALAHGGLDVAGAQFAPATLQSGDTRVSVDIALAGPEPVHFAGPERWSLRVAVRGGARVHGARAFTLFNPDALDHETALLRLRHATLAGLPSPQHDVVALTLNGRALGAMIFVEHYGRDLFERRGVDVGPVLRLTADPDTANALAARLVPDGPRGDATSEGKLERAAIGRLRAALAGEVRLSQVLAVGTTARTLAIAELWNARGALAWSRWRLAYDAGSARFIPFLRPGAEQRDARAPDADGGGFAVLGASQLGRLVLEDATLRDALVRALHEQADFLVRDEIAAELARESRQWLPSLPRDAAPHASTALDAAARRAREVSREEPAPPPPAPEVSAYVYEDRSGQVLELSNASTQAVEITTLAWQRGNDGTAPRVQRRHSSSSPERVSRSHSSPRRAGIRRRASKCAFASRRLPAPRGASSAARALRATTKNMRSSHISTRHRSPPPRSRTHRSTMRSPCTRSSSTTAPRTSCAFRGDRGASTATWSRRAACRW